MKGITWGMVVLVGAVVISLSPQIIAAGDAPISRTPQGVDMRDFPRITAEELKAKLGDSDVIVLDVRPARQWEASDQQIPGAVREDHLDVEGWAGKYPHDKTLVIYCG